MDATESDPFLAVIRELLRIHSKIRRLFRQVEEATRLSTMELAVLATIAESSFPLTASDIGRRLGYPRQVIQRTANELAARGLSEGRPNPAHKRAQLLVLTPAGIELKAVADRRAKEISGMLLKGLDVATCAELAAELRNVRSAIDGHLAEAGA
jgi:DNA-binding MarR family transcriptional regulator